MQNAATTKEAKEVEKELKKEQASLTKMNKEMSKKVANDAAAFARSLAAERGRNVEWAEKAVREAASISGEDALKARVIDVIASNVDDLLAKLEGREVAILGSTRHLGHHCRQQYGARHANSGPRRTGRLHDCCRGGATYS